MQKIINMLLMVCTGTVVFSQTPLEKNTTVSGQSARKPVRVCAIQNADFAGKTALAHLRQCGLIKNGLIPSKPAKLTV